MANDEGGATTVFVVANSAIVRAGLTALIERDERFIVAGRAAQIAALFDNDSFAAQTVDVLLLDMEGQTEDWFEILPRFAGSSEEKSDFPAIVALVPNLPTSGRAVEALQRGARGILLRAASEREITAAIEAAANNLIVLPPEIVETVFLTTNEQNLPADIENNSPDEWIETLTPREREVLEMLAEGASNKLIAQRLSISEHTVKFHVSSIFGKLNVTTRTEAVTEGLRRGLILL